MRVVLGHLYFFGLLLGFASIASIAAFAFADVQCWKPVPPGVNSCREVVIVYIHVIGIVLGVFSVFEIVDLQSKK